MTTTTRSASEQYSLANEFSNHRVGHGLEGLLPHKRGPHNPHKLTAPVRNYLHELLAAEPSLSSEELSRRVRERFKIELHPRTIQKALHPKAKRGRLK